MGELRKHSLEALQSKLGVDEAKSIYYLARGIDNGAVEPAKAAKSITSAKTLTPNAQSQEELVGWLQVLSKELSGRLAASGVWPGTIGLTLTGLGNISRARSTSMTSFRGSLNSIDNITQLILIQACKLLDGVTLPCTRITLSLSHLAAPPTQKNNIQSFFQPFIKPKRTLPALIEEREEKKEKVTQKITSSDQTVSTKKKSILSFFQDTPSRPYLPDIIDICAEQEAIETLGTKRCPKCQTYISEENFPVHMDHHLALSLQESFDLEANIITTTPKSSRLSTKQAKLDQYLSPSRSK